MLGKLIKHEFKAMARIIPFIYLALAFLLFINFIAHTLKIDFLVGVSSVLLIIGLVGSVIFTVITAIVRYYKSMFGQEGYLTQTLPVSKRQLVFSKGIVSIITFLVSGLVSIAGLFIYLSYMGLFKEGVQDILNRILIQFNIGGISGLVTILSFIAVMTVIEIVFFLVQIYLASTIANVAPFNKLGGGGVFLYYIAINFIIQAIESILMFIIPLSIEINKNGISFGTQTMGLSLFKNQNAFPIIIGLGGYMFVAVAVVAMIFIVIKLTNKKVSLK